MVGYTPIAQGTTAMKRPLSICCLLLFTLLLTACADNNPITTVSTSSNTPPTQATSLSITTAIGNFHEYPLPQSNSGMMRPAIDHEGRIWFGEMGRNYLAVFDPRTQTFRQMVPPHGQDGIM